MLAEVDSSGVHLLEYCTEVHFLSIFTLFEYIFFLETCYFNFTTSERQILCFSLHYISIKVLEVESHDEAALKVSE